MQKAAPPLLVTLAASLAMLPAAFATVDPDQVFVDLPLLPYPGVQICLGANCSTAPLGMTQHPDCNHAGPAVPRPLNFSLPGIPATGTPGLYLEALGDGSKSGLNYRGPAYGIAIIPEPLQDFALEYFELQQALGERVARGFGYKGRFDSNGSVTFPADGALGGWSGAYALPALSYDSFNVKAPAASLPASIQPYVSQSFDIGGSPYSSLTFGSNLRPGVENALALSGNIGWEWNRCRRVQLPVDPNFVRTGRNGGGSWGQRQDDQWAIKRVGFTSDNSSAWNELPAQLAPVIVAVIDTGLDWLHPDIERKSVWRNRNEIPDNGIDDDNNGYVDDIVGWNFLAKNNSPWDFDGHGTVVAGVIAAAHNNVGIAGINPAAQIMVLKAVNNFGTTRASYLAQAIVYAANNGARIINLSVGGSGVSEMERAAIDYASSKGVLIIAASGNEGIELEDYGPGGNDKVLTVGATFFDDRAAAFSNFGDKVDLVAPGVDVLSLRAHYTDANYRPLYDDQYVPGTNAVGEDGAYLRVSGTSFSAPIVAATASLLMAKNPDMTAAQVEERLILTAEDVELPGKDKYAGFGLINAKAALGAAGDFFVTAEISGIELLQSEAGEAIQVKGTIDADHFKRAWMQIGAGENPGAWKYVGQKRKYPIRNGVLGTVPISEFAGAELWQLVINVEHKNGATKSARYPVRIK